MELVALLSSPPENLNGPTLVIDTRAWQKIIQYARISAPNEINGFGFLQQWGDLFVLADPDDVVIIRQRVNPGSAENDNGDYALLQDRALQEGRPEQLCLQWHSHVGGEVYFSSRDMATIEGYGRMFAERMLSLVVNVHGQVFARYDQFQPLRLGMPIPVYLGMDNNLALAATLRAEVTELVSVRPPVEQNSSRGLARLGKGRSGR